MSFKGVIYKTKLSLKENSPVIFLALGAVGFVTTVIMACKATTKLEGIVDSHNEKISEVKKAEEDGVIETDDGEVEYSLEDAKKDKFIVSCKTGKELLKIYAPSIIFGVASLSCFLTSYKILSVRYATMCSIAAALSDTLNNYRKRVREELGDEADRRFYTGVKSETSIIETDDGKGKVKKEEITVDSYDPNGIPIYAKFFDESNDQWSKSPTVNLSFLKGMELRANDLFKERGVLLLNDVYSMLGIPVTEIGSRVGWFEGHGDQFVDFGMFNGSDERKRAFINGYEPSILLCFNCVPLLPGDVSHH